ncbi:MULTISPECIES: hypothetical protein [unclassified Nostoc]|nr:MULTISPECIES: hypothetical protein [unclassified Nostoc]
MSDNKQRSHRSPLISQPQSAQTSVPLQPCNRFWFDQILHLYC